MLDSQFPGHLSASTEQSTRGPPSRIQRRTTIYTGSRKPPALRSVHPPWQEIVAAQSGRRHPLRHGERLRRVVHGLPGRALRHARSEDARGRIPIRHNHTGQSGRRRREDGGHLQGCAADWGAEQSR